MSPELYDEARLRECGELIAGAARELFALGFAPATSGNFSMRLDDRHLAITVSGRDKGKLSPGDVMVVDAGGTPVGSVERASAETPLHLQLYRRYREVGCVLHTHSVVQTVASRVLARGGVVSLARYELLKALSGHTSHDVEVELPVVPNSQDMDTLAGSVQPLLATGMWGYLIEGHGLYVWGRDMVEARRHLDAFEFLLSCELSTRRYRS